MTNCMLFHLCLKRSPPGVFCTLRVPFPKQEHMKFSAFCWYLSKTGAWRPAFPCIRDCNMTNKQTKSSTTPKLKHNSSSAVVLAVYYLGNKGLNPSILDVPAKLGHAPTSTTHGVSVPAQVIQVQLVVCGLVQPGSSP